MLRKKRKAEPTHPARDPKIEFFLTASHQLKSPVAIIQWCVQSILENPSTDSRTRNLAQKALGQADAMSLLIGDMLRMFRVMNRPKHSAIEPVHMNQVIDEAIHQCEPFAERNRAHILKGPIESLPVVLADEPYIKQAVINLIDNAIKYSKKGGTVTVTARASAEGFVEVSVQDQGIGIPELEQQRIFTEFFRGEEAKETATDGTGLGLVLVKHIVETFGGSIRFTSRLHHGSTFTILLPYQADPPTASKGR